MRILRGEPTPEAEELAQAGLAILGGCLVWKGQPRWGCTKCGSEWVRKPPVRGGRIQRRHDL